VIGDARVLPVYLADENGIPAVMMMMLIDTTVVPHCRRMLSVCLSIAPMSMDAEDQHNGNQKSMD
jgi:hypothetical protein